VQPSSETSSSHPCHHSVPAGAPCSPSRAVAFPGKPAADRIALARCAPHRLFHRIGWPWSLDARTGRGCSGRVAARREHGPGRRRRAGPRHVRGVPCDIETGREALSLSGGPLLFGPHLITCSIAAGGGGLVVVPAFASSLIFPRPCPHTTCTTGHRRHAGIFLALFMLVF
jgi:hypothetical protein